MRRLASLLFTAGLTGLLLPPAAAQAQLARTYVSAAIGNDSNDCNRATPCRTFQAAHDKTFDQGEITVLDPGGYGGVTITKSIAIVNDGVGEAGVLVSGGATGITVNAPNAYVHLRGLTIQGIGFGGGDGIRLDKGYSLSISNCVVRNLIGKGIQFLPSADARLVVLNTLIADNGDQGITIFPGGSGAVRVAIDGAEVRNNSSYGVIVSGNNSTGTISVTMANSVSAGNLMGAYADSDPAKAQTTVMAVRSVVTNNTNRGLYAFGAKARVLVGNSAVSGNAATWGAFSGGIVQSFGDNHIAGNADGDPALPVIAKK
jgi:hypothetical protein